MLAHQTTYFDVVLCILFYIKGALFCKFRFSTQSPLELRDYFEANWADDPTNDNPPPATVSSKMIFLFHGEVRSKQSEFIMVGVLGFSIYY